MTARGRCWTGGIFLCLAVLGAVMTLPESAPRPGEGTGGEPFRWDREHLFDSLEAEFQEIRGGPPSAGVAAARSLRDLALESLARLRGKDAVPSAELERLEESLFRLGALAAAESELVPVLQDLVTRVRREVLAAARRWPVNEASVHGAIYRVIYGGRAALEEAILQSPDPRPIQVWTEAMVPSATPSIFVHGVRVHSGDVLLSRGGAPTSALIARGNDFPGNFSHAALVHVDGKTGEGTVIESLIERGAVLSSTQAYLGDEKLRILLLRLRPDSPAIRSDPLAPHRAATAMLERVRQGRIPYDFAMDWTDDEAFFCSEVPYHAYRAVSIELWSYRSRISSPGVVAVLGSLGVRRFSTLIPSDLEYDPQLIPVAEWRDPETLRKDRADNAVLDALLEEAERGARLGYPWYKLPAARLVKVWSMLCSTPGGAPGGPGRDGGGRCPEDRRPRAPCPPARLECAGG